MIEALNEAGLSDLAIGLILGAVAMLVGLWVVSPTFDLEHVGLRRSKAEEYADEVREQLELAAQVDGGPHDGSIARGQQPRGAAARRLGRAPGVAGREGVGRDEEPGGA